MINFNIEKIAPLCSEFGIILDETKIKKLNLYGNLLIEWNEKINLTAITDPEDVLYKHFYDCILFFKHNNVPQGASLIDVGTGAGFPGLVLKIVREDLKVTLLDSLNKRITFLKDVIDKCDLKDIEAIHSRAEDGGKSPLYREKYDIACARAVANMPVLMEYCMPFVKVWGRFIALKSVNEDMSAADNAAKQLGGDKPSVTDYKLPNGDDRRLVITKKIIQTPTKFPRSTANIAKKPL